MLQACCSERFKFRVYVYKEFRKGYGYVFQEFGVRHGLGCGTVRGFERGMFSRGFRLVVSERCTVSDRFNISGLGSAQCSEL